VARIREEQTRRAELETHYAQLLEEYVQRDVKIAELRAELTQYQTYFAQLCLTIQRQEHQGWPFQ
jgi:hypothetical protein